MRHYGRRSSWARGEEFSVPIEWIENDDIAVAGKSLPASLLPFAKKHITPDDEEVMVNAFCHGYNDEGIRTGDPDDCYPPEGEDEREILSILFPDGTALRDRNKTEAGQHYFDQWADHVQSYIDQQEIDTGPEERDYEEDD